MLRRKFLQNLQVRKSAGIRDRNLILVGGIDPITSSRSKFERSVLLLDLDSLEIKEIVTEVKSKPFLLAASSSSRIVAGIPFNLSYQQSGVFVMHISGLEREYVIDDLGVVFNITANQFDNSCFVLSGLQGQTWLSEIPDSGIHKRRTLMDKNVVEVQQVASNKRLLRLEDDQGVQYNLCENNGEVTDWKYRTANRIGLVIGNTSLATFDSEHDSAATEVVDLQSGRVLRTGPIGSAFGVSPVWMGGNLIAYVNSNFDVVILNYEDFSSRVISLARTEKTAWVELCMDKEANTLIAVCTGDHMAPNTEVIVFGSGNWCSYSQ
ncbi:MAG: hypothetical protein KDB22_24355 [Planctomycetales bacterium]|nr:hypothetical protein [Planctomycetales bacterium]